MGQIFTQVWKRFRPTAEGQLPRIIMGGLDAAGKTSILYQLKLGELVNTIPTIGFNVETIVINNVSFFVWDMGFRENLRPLQRHYYPNTQGLIFVVDSADRDRFEDVKKELRYLLTNEDLRDIPVLIYANKQDLHEAVQPGDLIEILGLNDQSFTQSRKWLIQSCIAVSGIGLMEGMEWLSKNVSK